MSTHTDMNVTIMREFIQSIDMDRFLRKEMETISSLNNADSSMRLKDLLIGQPGRFKSSTLPVAAPTIVSTTSQTTNQKKFGCRLPFADRQSFSSWKFFSRQQSSTADSRHASQLHAAVRKRVVRRPKFSAEVNSAGRSRLLPKCFVKPNFLVRQASVP